MPLTFVFDTNFVRSFSQNDFLSGVVPQRLVQQIKRIIARGDSIAILETVRLEVNAWLSKAIEARDSELKQAVQKLESVGYILDSTKVAVRPLDDFFDLLKSVEESCFLMLPEIEDYREAERRTSFRLPPHPKNVDGEEMRDRVIWCQLLNYAAKSGHQIVLVSNDTIFKNGAFTEEARELGIECVADTELDQRIGVRADYIIEIIKMIGSFSEQLVACGIDLTFNNIDSIEELRKQNEPDGTVTLKFVLLSHASGLPERCAVTLSALGAEAYFIQIDSDQPVSFSRLLGGAQGQELARFSQVMTRQKELNELRHILER
jgi:hypothetical protein